MGMHEMSQAEFDKFVDAIALRVVEKLAERNAVVPVYLPAPAVWPSPHYPYPYGAGFRW